VAVGGRVHWVCGLGISREAALKPGSDAVRLEYEYATEEKDGGENHAQ